MPLLFEGHGITQILLAVGHTTAIKADVFGLFGQLFDLIEFLITCQDAEMARMVTVTHVFAHGLSSSSDSHNLSGWGAYSKLAVSIKGLQDRDPESDTVDTWKSVNGGSFRIHPTSQNAKLSP